MGVMRVRALTWSVATGVMLVGAYYSLQKPLADPAAPLAHTDHAAKHGGSFFMAPNGFHHVEGTLRGREFRLYLYDNFTRSVDARPFHARVGASPLTPDPGGRYLRFVFEETPQRPATVTVFVRFRQDRPEDRFDFGFPVEAPSRPIRPIEPVVR
jgi:hypothetical protein